MSQTLNLANFNSINLKEATFLTSDAAAAQAVLTVQNNQNFAADDFFILGALGSEASELLSVSSVSGSSGVTASASLARTHRQNEPVTKLAANKLRIYRAAASGSSAPADTDFSLLATIDIDTDQMQTQYTDSGGSSNYWYKYTYYNSVASTETTLAESIAVRGGGVGNYASIESIRREAGIVNNRWVSDPEVDEKRQAAQQEINSRLSGIYTLPFTSPINPLIAEITRLLAAGFILLKNYGPQSTITTADGEQKVNKARELLSKLDSKELVLTDTSGTDISVPGTGAGFTGWPDASTETAAPTSGGGERKFRVSDRY